MDDLLMLWLVRTAVARPERDSTILGGDFASLVTRANARAFKLNPKRLELCLLFRRAVI